MHSDCVLGISTYFSVYGTYIIAIGLAMTIISIYGRQHIYLPNTFAFLHIGLTYLIHDLLLSTVGISLVQHPTRFMFTDSYKNPRCRLS